MYIEDRIKRIANQMELNYKILSIKENKRLTRAIARVIINRKKQTAEIELSKTFMLKLTKEGQDVVIKHELMHIKHSELTNKPSNHGKEFKDLCYKYFGDRSIGNAILNVEYIKSAE